MIQSALVLGIWSLGIAGCTQPNLEEPAPADSQLFAPVSMRIHRIFTQVKDWNPGYASGAITSGAEAQGVGEPASGKKTADGIEVLVEFIDEFGDSAKAAGTFRFELFDYRPGDPEPRGFRIVNPWQASIVTARDQRNRWNRVSHTYTFRLAYPAIRRDKSYVLTAQFDALSSNPGNPGNTGGTGSKSGRRFFDRIILPGQEPTTQPTTQPATRPSGGLFNF